ncbi:MAG: YihY/virulence factor BrkB family protein [Candidatus Korobacteraceae bacterium]
MSTLSLLQAATKNSLRDIGRNHIMAFAAALSYYFVLSLFPALILLAALLVLLPTPNLFPQILNLMSRTVPPYAMGLVRQITVSVVSPNSGTLFSFGVLGVAWSATTGFASLIEALNVAYDVPETRPYWKTRVLAMLMALEVGGLLLVALAFEVVGPDFGSWLARHLGLGPLLQIMWPFLRWGVSVAFTLFAIYASYKVAPNIRQRISQLLPGAVIATAFWILLSYGLGIYFRSFAHFNKTYGTLGAAIALMMWIYYTSFVILLGAEFNSELMQLRGGGRLELKQPPPPTVKPQPATESETDVAA